MVVSSLITRRMRNIYKIPSTYGARAYAISTSRQTQTQIVSIYTCINLLTIAKQQSCYKFVSFAFEIPPNRIATSASTRIVNWPFNELQAA